MNEIKKIEIRVIDKGLDIRVIDVADLKDCFKEIRNIMKEFDIKGGFVKSGRKAEVSLFLSGRMAIIDGVAILQDREGLIIDFGDWSKMMFIKGVTFNDFTKKIIDGDVS